MKTQILNENKVDNIVWPGNMIWTNGCFDLLHIGHIDILQKAKRLGSYLIVGINSDNSVRKLKGKDRPIFKLEYRIISLAVLPFIDFIIPFDDLRPYELLRKIKPSIFVKADDYTLETLDQKEVEIINSYGGKIEFIKTVYDISTSKIIEKIKAME